RPFGEPAGGPTRRGPRQARSTHEALIRDSWTRCEGYGLTHRSPPRFSAEDGLDIPTLLHTQHTLLHTTQREVLPYYENILANSRCLVLLADAQGLLLHAWGDRRSIEPALQPGFRDRKSTRLNSSHVKNS